MKTLWARREKRRGRSTGKGVGAKDRVKEASMAAAEEGSKPQNTTMIVDGKETNGGKKNIGARTVKEGGGMGEEDVVVRTRVSHL